MYAPCALGGALSDAVVDVLTAPVVCGAANNQLAHPGVEKVLADRGVLYAPDYVVNSGGVIQVADEYRGYVPERAHAKATAIFDTTRGIFATAGRGGHSAGGGGGPAGRAADGRGRPAARDPGPRPLRLSRRQPTGRCGRCANGRSRSADRVMRHAVEPGGRDATWYEWRVGCSLEPRR